MSQVMMTSEERRTVSYAVPTVSRTADKVLRDAAFVLAMTRRVKEEMLDDRLMAKLARR